MKIARCLICGEARNDLIAIYPSRFGGKNPRYICPACVTNRAGYHSRQLITERGKTVNKTWLGATLSAEIEFCAASPLGVAELFSRGYGVPERDGSLPSGGGESNKRYDNNGRGLYATFRALERLKESGDIEIDRRAGLHIHIGGLFTASGLDTIDRYYAQLFAAFNRPENRPYRLAVFGRDFNDYATTEADAGKYRHINTRHYEHETLEFRLPAFKNASQAIAAAALARRIACIIKRDMIGDYIAHPFTTSEKIEEALIEAAHRLENGEAPINRI